ncbi:hypothetical protein IQ276_021465 [Desmonostoc muscorum LEGE 12446]|uniref:Uncharacterized protein n=1 Tax=Desmonostoc muscorum LEGE 12446 TaxID=1828758 RepID=A0A8J7D9X0_DESMC|nr:hypothetical protein [Desmonostoc muscorum]MCF2148947.1 hypothetical protein [Desmonostoc muscorum LEGE 12446]
MQNLFQSAKRLISVCLVTLLIVTTTLITFPSPARADVIIFQCNSDCGSFTTGVLSGSAVTLAATGQTGTLVEAAAAIGQVAMTTAAPLAAASAAVVAAAPILVPVAATAAVGYGAYRMWESFGQNNTKDYER